MINDDILMDVANQLIGVSSAAEAQIVHVAKRTKEVSYATNH